MPRGNVAATRAAATSEPSTRTRPALIAVAGLFGTATLISSVAMLLRQRAIRRPPTIERSAMPRGLLQSLGAHNGCAFPDGLSYCAQATGRVGVRPFTYRPLAPFAARIVHAISAWSLPGSFQFVAFCGFVLTICGLGGLAYGTARRSGEHARQARMIAFGAVLLWIGTPYALRFVLTAPVFVDELATGLATIWLAVFFARTFQFQWFLAPLLAVFATLAREVGVATVTITCVTAVILRIVPLRNAVVNCAAATCAFAFDLSQPHTAHSENSPNMAWEVFLKWVHHPHMALSAILMGTGLAIFALVPTSLLRTLGAVVDARYVAALVPTAVALVASSPFLGRELPRFSSGATPILCLLLALYLVLVADTLRIALLTTAAIVFLHEWKVFGVIARSQRGYMNYFYGRTVFHLAAVVPLAAIATVLFIIDLQARPAKPRLQRPVGHVRAVKGSGRTPMTL